MLSVVWILFAAIMITAAVIDLISYRIPNLLVIGLLALFALVAAINWSEVQWVSHIAAAVTVFGAGLFLYAFRQMGAGDVKLLAVAALWSGVVPPAFPALLLFISLCGLFGMLVILALRFVVPHFQPSGAGGQRALPRVLTRGQGIPYAIGIAPGSIIASFSFPSWVWQL